MPMEQGGEQGRWEEERLKTASLTFGAKKEREQGMRREQERYQLLLEDDEMIDFVSTAITMKGTLTEKVRFIGAKLLLMGSIHQQKGPHTHILLFGRSVTVIKWHIHHFDMFI